MVALSEIVSRLRQSLGIQQKQDIQLAARYLRGSQTGRMPVSQLFSDRVDPSDSILLGDDCAAIQQGDRYLLLAAEGMLPSLVTEEPWFAGWCAVMVNVSDIYAMGGEPIAVVDTLWLPSGGESGELWGGMQAAAEAYNVPIVGGHTNCHSPYSALSVAILGQARHLITSFNARVGDVLLMAIDLRGQFYKHYPFWNAATASDRQRLRDDLAILPHIADRGWCDAGKDISMGGIVGTALMLLETSRCGAVIDLAAIPQPVGCDRLAWLQSFPSYGFLLSARSQSVQPIREAFQERGLCCEAIGSINNSRELTLKLGTESTALWNLAEKPLTGWGK
ncbi:MAG: sll0787 family AIR synthase-like protein [Cyanobacteria bacterium SBLK]|nr:sll0787 family AIR synthase-like protein [Cyanobacteria bacterium SBLK]